MRQILSGLVAILGVWLIAAPWIMRTGLEFGQIASMAAGAIFLILGIVGCTRKTAYFGAGDWLTLVCGVAIFIIGIVAFEADPCTRASEIVCGLIIVIVSWMGVHFPKTQRNSKVYSIEGQLLVEVKKVVADKHGIGAKAILMGAMPKTVYFHPGELYVLLGQVPAGTVFAIIKELFMSSPSQASSDSKKKN